jgi:ribosomal protein S18 acetylase RimI-like enzyme
MPGATEVLDRFYSVRLGVSLPDLKAGQVGVGTCDRRTYAERGFGFVRLLWVMQFGDRAAVSVHPAALADVARLAWGRKPEEMLQDDFVSPAWQALQRALPGVAMAGGGMSVICYHPGGAEAVPCEGEVRALAPGDTDKRTGEHPYMSAAEHPSAARGEAFGVFVGEGLVGEIITHEPPVAEMAHLVAEDGIGVAEEYRGRGYGKALLAAWTRDMQARGRVCVHSTSVGNAASLGLAKSVGYVEYARGRAVTWGEGE